MPEIEMEEDITRMSFNLPRNIYRRFIDQVPHGVRSTFLRKLVEIAITRVEIGGAPILGAIIKGDFDPFQKIKGE